jgi:hypothetical protein
MDTGNVPEVSGTGLRQFSGIFSVTDLSGNNLFTVSSTAIVAGNNITSPLVEYIAPVIQQTDPSAPIQVLTLSTAPLNQKNTLIRLGGGGSGSFAISAAQDATPTIASENLIVGNRNGATFSSLNFGQAGSTFPVTFATTGACTFTGNISPQGGVFSGSTVAPNWPSGAPGGIFTAPNVPFSVYLVSVTITGSNDTAHYNTVAIFSTNGPDARVTVLQQGSLMTLSVSGLTLLFIQGNGATANVNSWWVRLV